jgi:16S rRNA (cytidine1402-2'-O)-methyltransferase
MKTGILYMVPSFLSEENSRVIPDATKEIIFSLDHFIVENEKSARHFLKAAGYPKPLQQLKLQVLNEHTKPQEISSLLQPLLSGTNVGIISEAGCPGVADPGSDAVKLAHEKNIEVIPLVGPSSILLALMASGMNGQRFTFLGYLPREKSLRVKAIRELEKNSITKNETQIFIEAPYRNAPLLEDILNTCNTETRLCIAIDITSPSQSVKTLTIKEWKKKIPEIQKRPLVFLVGS